MRILILSALLGLSGCETNMDKAAPEIAQEDQVKVVTIKKEFVPHIWSDHKVLKTSVESCGNKAKEILESLGFNQVVKNGDYAYGNYSNNRGVIKCVSVNGSTFAYAAVAGPKVKIVEKLRNEIVWKL